MSKEAEDFFRQRKIKQAKSENIKKFLELVSFEKEGEIMQEYLEQQLRLYVVSKRISRYWMYSALFGLGYILVDIITYVC